MTGLPYFVSTRAFDAAQGTAASDNDDEIDWIEKHITAIEAAAEALTMSEHSNWGVRTTCKQVGAEVLAMMADLKKQVLP